MILYIANLVLHRTIERIHVRDKYGDIDIGVIIIRGENVVLCGEIVRLVIFFGVEFFYNFLSILFRTLKRKIICLLSRCP